MKQVLALSATFPRWALEKMIQLGIVTISKSVIFSEDPKTGDDIAFVGDEEEVLARIRAIPLSKEGKKGTSRSVLVKMVADRLSRIEDCRIKAWHPTADQLILLRDKVRADLWEQHTNFMKMKEAAEAVFLTEFKMRNWETWGDLRRFLNRSDVDESVLRDGFDLWSVRDIMLA
jgi:hypothetical protein